MRNWKWIVGYLIFVAIVLLFPVDGPNEIARLFILAPMGLALIFLVIIGSEKFVANQEGRVSTDGPVYLIALCVALLTVILFSFWVGMQMGW